MSSGESDAEQPLERIRVSEGDEVIQWGELILTPSRIIFVPRGVLRPEDDRVLLHIHTKDARSLMLWFGVNDMFTLADATKAAERTYSLIARVASEKSPHPSWPAFTMRSKALRDKRNDAEYLRQIQRTNSLWIEKDNSHFSYPTFPPSFLLPQALEHQTPMTIRSHCMPALSFIRSGVLLRAAQIRVLNNTSESQQDALFLKTCTTTSLFVLDAGTAPPVTPPAVMGEAAGYCGYYSQLSHEYLGVPPLAAVRDAAQQLAQLCEAPAALKDDGFFMRLDQTGWIQQQALLLAAATRAAKILDSGNSVLVQCPTGTDATVQIVSLALLILEPQHRTLKKFCAMIEREWVLMGHKFASRCGHGNFGNEGTSEEVAPYFVQFLDAVHQLLEQHPTSFEFNEALLLWLAEAVYNGQFVNFLFDCEKDRSTHRETGADAWAFVFAHAHLFTNPLFVPSPERTSSLPLPVDAHIRSVTLWRNFWLQRVRLLSYPRVLLEIERLNLSIKTLREAVQAAEQAAKNRNQTLSERGEPALAQLQAEYRALKEQCHVALLGLEKLKTERGAVQEQNKELTALVTQLRKRSVTNRK